LGNLAHLNLSILNSIILYRFHLNQILTPLSGRDGKFLFKVS